jgi:haloalkane dehalogenase
MVYVDEGEGDAIVFAHGNPTSSYLWRNVMPHLEGAARLVAADMIGMGGSDKLSPSGPDRYSYAEQRDYLFALWDSLDLGDNVILVLHDWGSVVGFDWACQHRDRVQGIVFMEGIVAEARWTDFPHDVADLFHGFRSPAGEHINAEPGEIINDRVREIIRMWPSLTETTVSGRHFIQEDSPHEIGQAIARFVRRLRSA